MNKAVDERAVESAEADRIQRQLVDYAVALRYEDLPPNVVHAAKVRIIDTLGALVGGFFDETSRLARDIAAETSGIGATVIGTRIKARPEMAAFANGTAARAVEMNDYERKPGGRNGHPSDAMLPVLAPAEDANASGKDFITAVVLTYEIYIRLADAVSDNAFDSVNFCSLATAAGAAKLWALTREQFAHCLSIAATANNELGQTRTGRLSMWKAMATGEAGRAGVFAATLARKGVEGPYLPFEGKYGWCRQVAHTKLALDPFGGKVLPFAIEKTILKPRSACFHTLAPILAAEKVVPALKGGFRDIERVSVEVYKYKERPGGGIAEPHWWHPESREVADHSIPYAVAATLMDGTVTPRSFDAAHLHGPELRALLARIEVVENPEFTAAYNRIPVEHCARVDVTTKAGERVVGESGGVHGGLEKRWSDEDVAAKFRSLSEDILGAKRVEAALDCLWNLERMKDVSEIATTFAFI